MMGGRVRDVVAALGLLSGLAAVLFVVFHVRTEDARDAERRSWEKGWAAEHRAEPCRILRAVPVDSDVSGARLVEGSPNLLRIQGTEGGARWSAMGSETVDVGEIAEPKAGFAGFLGGAPPWADVRIPGPGGCTGRGEALECRVSWEQEAATAAEAMRIAQAFVGRPFCFDRVEWRREEAVVRIEGRVVMAQENP